MGSFSSKRNYIAILLTLLFIVFLGAVYFFIYIPQSEQRLREQRFRSLQSIDRNIHEKIDNGYALMNNLLKSGTTRTYLQHLSAVSKNNFSLTINTPLASDVLYLNNVADSSFLVDVDNTTRQVHLALQKRTVNGGDTSTHTITMAFSLAQFFGNLLPKNVFEEYVVFNESEAVYTTAAAGVRDLKDSLFSEGAAGPASVMRDYTLGGTDYKLFSHPVSFISADDLVVAGLVSARQFHQERNKLPFEIVLLLVTILLAIIISFPWIKLYHMGNKDRLKITDAVASIVASMLLMSLLFFAFFKYNRSFRPSHEQDPKSVLAKQISRAFHEEIRSAYQTLNFINQIVEKRPQVFRDFAYKDSLLLKTLAADDSSALWKERSDTGIRQILWLAHNGDELVNWTWDSMNAPHGNFRQRAYHQSIVSAKAFLLDADTARPFYLDQVISWTDGRFTSVLSIPSAAMDSSKKSAVVAMSFRMKSLHQPLLTPGYLFAVMDKNGRVLYHSDESRNLNENLMTEVSEQDHLRSALEARTEDAFTSRYFGKEYSVQVMPLSQLPYSLLIFSDLGYQATREMAIYSFTFSMFLLLCLFFVVQLFVVFLVSSKRSFFKKQLYDTAWVGPKIKSHHQYNLAIQFNFFVIFLAISFFRVSTFLTYVFILLFSVSFISFFLNSLFASAYRNTNNREYYLFKKRTLWSLGIFMVLIELAAFFFLDRSSIVALIIYQLATVGAGLFFYMYGGKILKGITRFSPPAYTVQWTYSQSFALMALSRLIITSGIPVVFFYLSAYNYEQNISIRYRQLQYANSLLTRLSNEELQTVSGNGPSKQRFYNDSVWVREIGLEKKEPRFQQSSEDAFTSKILDGFRFNFTDIAVNEDQFSVSHAADTAFFFNPLLKDACKENGATITYRKTPLPEHYVSIASAGLNYRLPSLFSTAPIKGFVFWTLLICALIIFYFLVHQILSKLFCLRLPDLSLCQALDEKIISNQATNNLLFVIGLPGSGKLSRIKEKIAAGDFEYAGQKLVYDDQPEKSSVCIADLITIPDSGEESEREKEWKEFSNQFFNERYKLVVVNHFEYNIQDSVTNRIKLNFLERLMLANKAKVVILSTIHPVAFLDSFMEQTTDRSVPGEDLERWHVLFGHYRIVVFPLKKIKVENKESSLHTLYKETEQTHFLNRVRGCVIEISKGLPEMERLPKADELIFKLQITSHYFYMYIWQSLTKEEKFLLYDLAEDNLVNSFDDYNLNMLMAKGVVRRRNGTLTLFNKGFRNFILTAIGNTEAMKIKNRIRDNGKWGSLRTPLVIVVVAILGFLLASQEEAYSKLITYVAALGAGIPAVLKLFSLFDKNAQKEY